MADSTAKTLEDDAVELEEDPPVEHSKEIKEIVLYIVFMFFFTLSTTQGLVDNSYFNFGSALKESLTGVEMKQEHSPSFDKNFYDVGTVEEFYQWMESALVHTVYTPNTFDADPGYAFQNGSSRLGYTLGYGKFLGPIRISQLRSQAFNCDDRVQGVLTANYSFRCFGSRDYMNFGQFTKKTELKDDFSNFTAVLNTSAGPVHGVQNFLYNGVTIKNGEDGEIVAVPIEDGSGVGSVDQSRKLYRSDFTTPLRGTTYPVPAYGVVMPTNLGITTAEKIILSLKESHYIDLHTRAIFVDMSVYNPMLDRMIYARLVGEITTAGGVMPDSEIRVVQLWKFVGRPEDYFQIGNEGVVALFYVYYFFQMLPKMFPKYRFSWAFFKSFLNCAQFANIVFFVSGTSMLWYADTLFPEEFDVNGDTFIEMWPSVRFRADATKIAGINVFLNWFKFISILSYDPNFGLINNTLARSAEGVVGFAIVFAIIFIGFAQAHCLIFVGRLENFRTVQESIFCLLRSLLGDFDFSELEDAHFFMGPVLFLIFVGLAVFVVLNMLIAIISDAYETCREEMKDYPPVSIFAEIRDYILTLLLKGWCQQLIKCCCRSLYDRISPDGASVHPEDEEGGGADGAGGSSEDASVNAIEESMQMAMAKMKSNSPSDLILIEWFDSLKQNEEDMSNLQKDMSLMKQDVGALKKHFDQGMAQVSIASDSMNMLVSTLRQRVSALNADVAMKDAAKKTI